MDFSQGWLAVDLGTELGAQLRSSVPFDLGVLSPAASWPATESTLPPSARGGCVWHHRSCVAMACKVCHHPCHGQGRTVGMQSLIFSSLRGMGVSSKIKVGSAVPVAPPSRAGFASRD
eukprot:12900042-Prorocentrum_lima.AAC.1